MSWRWSEDTVLPAVKLLEEGCLLEGEVVGISNETNPGMLRG